MCQKHTLKHFFVLVNHPHPLQKPYVLGVLKHTPQTQNIFESTRNTVFLTEKQTKFLGYPYNEASKTFLLPIEIPKDWFIH